jgi:hypothetical protein
MRHEDKSEMPFRQKEISKFAERWNYEHGHSRQISPSVASSMLQTGFPQVRDEITELSVIPRRDDRAADAENFSESYSREHVYRSIGVRYGSLNRWIMSRRRQLRTHRCNLEQSTFYKCRINELFAFYVRDRLLRRKPNSVNLPILWQIRGHETIEPCF